MDLTWWQLFLYLLIIGLGFGLLYWDSWVFRAMGAVIIVTTITSLLYAMFP